MITKILRINIVAEVMIINDNGEVENLIETKPIVIYKGTEFNYEKFIGIVEESTLQSYTTNRSPSNR